MHFGYVFSKQILFTDLQTLMGFTMLIEISVINTIIEAFSLTKSWKNSLLFLIDDT